jgi:NAD(P)-dependent dehydrogenase (short-subunit alcohol dehydrogenase family)
MVRQSSPLEFPGPVDDAWLSGKCIIVAGGASGIGLGFIRRWAAAGTTVVFGDINIKHGEAVEKSVREGYKDAKVYFVPCDVINWLAQVNLFKRAVEHSQHGGMDGVVANAGTTDRGQPLSCQQALTWMSRHHQISGCWMST